MSIIERLGKRVSGDKINLGTLNWCGEELMSLFNELKNIEIKGSGSSVNLGRCYNEYFFDVEIDGVRYSVSYKIDSSD